jgi:hypothetical protein
LRARAAVKMAAMRRGEIQHGVLVAGGRALLDPADDFRFVCSAGPMPASPGPGDSAPFRRERIGRRGLASRYLKIVGSPARFLPRIDSFANGNACPATPPARAARLQIACIAGNPVATACAKGQVALIVGHETWYAGTCGIAHVAVEVLALRGSPASSPSTTMLPWRRPPASQRLLPRHRDRQPALKVDSTEEHWRQGLHHDEYSRNT